MLGSRNLLSHVRYVDFDDSNFSNLRKNQQFRIKLIIIIPVITLSSDSSTVSTIR